MVSDALVELVDVAPTLLVIAGLERPETMHGRSLLPLLRGTRADDDHRRVVRCEYYRALNPRPRSATPPLDASLIRPSYATMVRDSRYKLVTYHGTGLGELFDLHTDPAEYDNRCHDPALADLRHHLLLQSLDSLALTTDLGPPPNRQLLTVAADGSAPREIVLIECLAKARSESRLPADVEFRRHQVKLAEHCRGEIDVHSLSRHLHAAPGW